ncbi:peptide ABC transporter permease [Halalkalibacillus sediminis]|uniref:Peptide ABC transporter permease n=1 Tax=Halalkalibacillus sediminis TaxID=2018042 RepID=A0A2I0QSP6_9BACI|nr:peptide ABC transporter permease [Halalkalibacillus sediminis]PKR77339.1 peptide ABC transporter permease [Halalkalibacillus sediminis]
MKKSLLFIKRNQLFTLGTLMLAFLLFIAFFGKYLPLVDSELTETPFKKTEEKISVPPYAPSNEHIIGSDQDGRDLLSLLVIGAKETLFIVCLITLMRYVMAFSLSYLAHKKIFGAHAILKVFNRFLSYVPTVIMVVLLAMLPPVLLTENRPFILILIIASVEVGRVGDMLKDEFDELSSREHMISGIAVGVSEWRLLKRYYLPFMFRNLVVHMVTDLGKVMFLLGQLGFIGIFISQGLVQAEIGQFEIRNESITWPVMLMNSISDLRGPIWIPFWSAFAMTFTIFTFHLFAQGLQDLSKRKETYFYK